MAYDLEPLRSYVRFYLAVLKQLHQARNTLVQTSIATQKALRPFEPYLEYVPNKAFEAALSSETDTPINLDALWRPEDELDLSGLTDVYEVVGRFSFQGENQDNLAAVQQVVSLIRNEIDKRLRHLDQLEKLPDDFERAAERLQAQLSHEAAELKAEKLKTFATLVDALHQRANQTSEAVHGVPLPSLADVAVAPEEYRLHVNKMDQIYNTCLPFLRKSLEDLYEFVGLQVPSSWPDSLPLQPDLPEELLTVPPSDSPELRRAKEQLEKLTQEENELQRVHDDLVATLRRLQAELAAQQEQLQTANQRAQEAKWNLVYAKKLEQVEQARKEYGELEQQRAHRSYRVGELLSKSKQAEAAIDAMEKELAKRKYEIGETGKQLAHERDNEPAIFGKDDWRSRVEALETQVEQMRQAYAQREAMLNQMKIDMSSLGVEAQNEQSQLSTLDRWMQDTKAREQKLMAELKQLEQKMGEQTPVVPLSVPEAEQRMADAQNAVSEVLERIERTKLEQRRNHEDGTRVLARQNQIKAEKQQMLSYTQSAQVAATQGFQEAMRQLAERRRLAVKQHSDEVIDQLDKSLQAIDEVFVEPARKALLAQLEPDLSKVEQLRGQVQPLAEVTERLKSDLEPALMAQEASMSQVQREFCDVAESACRNAWT